MKKYYRDNQEVSATQWNIMLKQDIRAVETKHRVTIEDAVLADVERDGNTVVNQHKYEWCWYNTNA